jgi:hypothetical protein
MAAQFPKLIALVEVVKVNSSFKFYTKDTCAEFHALLIALLGRFKTSLMKLAKARGNAGVLTKGSDEFKAKIVVVLFYGYALQHLAKGAALRTHLQTIAPLLRSGGMPAPDGEGEELDEDLKVVHPCTGVEGKTTPPPLWMSYFDWLRLILSHFDAVDILTRYVSGAHFQHSAISVQILVAPPAGKRLLPWRELLIDPTLFPQQATWDLLSAKAAANSNISNAMIVKFLDNSLESSSNAKSVKTLWGKWGKDKWNRIYTANDIVSHLKIVESFKLPGWGEYAKKLLATFEVLKDTPKPNSNLLQEISNDIQSLCDNTRFFTSAIGDTQDFSGALHCEINFCG